MGSHMAGFFRAWRFLTIIPLGAQSDTMPGDMASSLSYYSLVGSVLGGILVMACRGMDALNLGTAGNVILISLLILLTGGLHLDGLGDAADGLFGGRSREQKLEIMRDSRVGTMGLLAVWIVLSLKVALLGEFSGTNKLRVLFLMPAVGRGAMVFSAVCFPYARKEGGKGSFVKGAGKTQLLLNGVFLSILALFLFGSKGIALLIIALGIGHFLSLGIARALGGLTGDTYGAVCEFTEMVVLLSGALLRL